MNEVFLGILLVFSFFFSIVAFLIALCMHERITDVKADVELKTKDIIYQSRERFASLENKFKEKW